MGVPTDAWREAFELGAMMDHHRRCDKAALMGVCVRTRAAPECVRV